MFNQFFFIDGRLIFTHQTMVAKNLGKIVKIMNKNILIFLI